jgi:hypothetical protein
LIPPLDTMVATPLLRERLMGLEKENGGGSAEAPSPASAPRLALFNASNAGAAESPWALRTKALTGASAPSRMSPADAQRTRANVTKARAAIEQWAKVAAACHS